MNVRRRVRGFSLLEVIAAILLLGLAFAALLAALGSSVKLTAHAADRSQAALWAQSLLDPAFAMEPVRAGVTQGRFDTRYRWRLDVQPWQPPAPPQRDDDAGDAASPIRLYRLDLEVLWGPPGREHNAHFVTLRAQDARAGGRGAP